MPPKKRLTKEKLELFDIRNLNAGEFQEEALNHLNRAENYLSGNKTRKTYLNLAMSDALNAARLYEQEKKFGPAEKMYELVNRISGEFLSEYKSGKTAISKWEYKRANEKNQMSSYGSKRTHDKRLFTLGKYVQRREDRKYGEGGLERASSATIAIVGLVGSMFLLSSNITGNVIGLDVNSSNALGAILLIAGIIGAFFYFKRK